MLATLECDGAFLLAADAVALRMNLTNEVMPRNTWDPDAALSSVNEIRRMERGGASVIFGHDPQQWETLRKGAHAYE